MNKKNIKFILFCFILCVIGCKSKKTIITSDFDEKSPVVIRLANNVPNRLSSIEIPLKLTLNNNSNYDLTFLRIFYKYNITKIQRTREYGINLFEKNVTMEKISNKKTTISRKSKIIFFGYSSHYPDSIQSEIFDKSINKMLAENKDTLHIGTVSEFKKKPKYLFEKLTKNDNISVQFLDNDKLGERITVPVKW